MENCDTRIDGNRDNNCNTGGTAYSRVFMQVCDDNISGVLIRSENDLAELPGIDERITELQQELKLSLLHSAAVPSSFSSEERVQTSPKQDGLEKIVIKLDETKTYLEQELLRLVTIKKQGVKMIYSIKDRKEKDVMIKYFIKGKCYDDIAIDLDCTVRGVRTIKDRALRHLFPKYAEKI